jgi:hypothetical protein
MDNYKEYLKGVIEMCYLVLSNDSLNDKHQEARATLNETIKRLEEYGGAESERT